MNGLMVSQDLSPLISPMAIAPMIDWTFTHFRVFMRLLAPQALLYTEMQTPGAIIHHPSRALHFSAMEKPLALQLGGADPAQLVHCAQLAEELGFSEVNLNLGCPSDRVQAGRFGACLMAEPDVVSACLSALKKAVNIPVTAKIRIGIDQQDSYAFFSSFAHRLVEAGCDKLIVHARKAWLKGLSPKQNRTIPPVNYDYVYDLKQEIKSIPIVINGNINTLHDVQLQLNHVDGVMLGRLAYQNPYALRQIHQALYTNTPPATRTAIFQQYLDYAAHQAQAPIHLLLKPVFNLAHGLPRASAWKQALMNILQDRSSACWKLALEELAVLEQSAA